MIPRVTRKLETTLLSSRQSLPRPARLYSTPSKRRNAPATATAQSTIPPDFPAFLPAEEFDIVTFLNRKAPLTMLPNPRPASDSSKTPDRFFTHSKTLDMMAIIDACLHNLYDVRRATELFNRLRSQVGTTALETQLYNAFLEAYLLKSKHEDHMKQHWINEVWSLYEVMEAEKEEVAPNAKTYSILLAAWHRYKPEGQLTFDNLPNLNPEYLVSKIVERKIPVMDVVCNPFLAEPALITEVAKALALAAAKLGFKDVLADLGHSSSTPIEDMVLRDIPEASPVTRETINSEGEIEHSMPFNLGSLREHLQRFTDARKMLDNDLMTRQRHLESSMYELAIEQLKFRAEKFRAQGLNDSNHLHNRSIQSLMWTWHNLLQERLKKEIATVQMNGAKNPDDAEVILHLSRVSPEKLSLLTILEIMRLSGTGGVLSGMKTARALISVGKAVEGEYKSQVCREHGLPYKEMQSKSGDFFSNLGYKHLHQRRVAAAQTMSDNEKWIAPLPQAVRSKVGGLLVHCLMEVAQITRTMKNRETGELISESQPAFFHAYEYQRGQKLGVIKLNPAVSDKLATDSLERTIHPRHLPMLVKPRPWINYKEGGYLYNKSSAMRFKENHEQEVYLREATNRGKIELIYAGLDVLSSTPWKVNKAIFEVVLEVWNSEERMGKIPPAVYDVEEPVLEAGKEHDMQAKSRYIQRHKLWSSNKANNHSDRCNVNYKIEIARAFLGDTIYMPHNLDFRGRAYPIPPHLNHIGDDLSRALLVFAEGKPLGVRGLRWLKIHLANLYGYDKAPFADRVKWAEENIENIKESARNPLKGSRWWAKADDPWQCLSTCMELKNALDLEDPTTYVSALPVHQDGTCNGLQHYAALGGDATGARQVNLSAGDRPSDVYTHISLLVEKDLAIDAAAGNATAQLLMGKVSRKVVKQTVMTTVYGVTYVGAREQIERQLRDRGDIPEELCWSASSYLAKKVLDTIGDTFKGAKAIQSWLHLCARLISKSIHENRLGLRPGPKGETVISLPMSQVKKEQMTSVIWTTSMGLPIVQPYRRTARRQVETAIQSVYISDPYKAAEVNTAKQASAFPPNFIHSLDATHMMLTALECKNHGLMFASVHDSYWTHACDVDQMSAIIRDTFIHLHSSGILEKLDQEFRERYGQHQIPLDGIFTNGGQFINKLRAAGGRIRLTSQQAAQSKLGGSKIKDLLEIVDDDTAASGMSAQILESTNEEESSHPSKRAEAFKLLAGKFVKFTDVIPPVPTRGTFKVEDIKSSLYFFS